MDIFFDRSTEPRYIEALDSGPWATTEFADDQFAQTAPDSRLVRYAADNGMVIFIRDSDFFKLVRARYNCALLFFTKGKGTTPGDIVEAVDKIRTAYTDHDTIEEGLPGT